MRRRGAALLLVLWLVALLGVLGATVARSARTRVGVAQGMRARTAARLAAESGVVAARREIEGRLEALGEGPARRDYLNALDAAIPASAAGVLGDARFTVAVRDVDALFDVNTATEETLARFLAQFAGAAAASDAARAIRARIEGSGTAALPLRSLEELRDIPALDERALAAALPHLTVDGDGRVNVSTASPRVRAFAGGQLVTMPSRLLVVSRGQAEGHALAHEVEAVFAVEGATLALVRRRERTP